ncbi:hypothetical protein [Aeromonas sp. MrichA-1]|uniref:hypothetical protein n=1 Tax=Aeromonas sp. MrichA-1 TaxID=2823362 RepID=UPI001B3252C5|nr:hypothetical protein [Aeromonas sp. MrichA-1]MBP4081703.1 hypothetical protein [Aeromonas sp. MrichA-1]
MPKQNIKTLTPEALFAYACGFAIRHEASYPTFRQAAKRFNCTYDEIENACADWDGANGYMAPSVGGATAGGFFEHEHRGDYLVEAYRVEN